MTDYSKILDTIDKVNAHLDELNEHVESFSDYIHKISDTLDIYGEISDPDEWALSSYLLSADDFLTEDIIRIQTVLNEFSNKIFKKSMMEETKRYLDEPNEISYSTFKDENNDYRSIIEIKHNGNFTRLEFPEDNLDYMLDEVRKMIQKEEVEEDDN